VANAICNAVGVRIKDLPITPERVLAAIREKKGLDLCGRKAGTNAGEACVIEE
jgi:xanthine dehydrogenase molybdenum-binding subunit